MTSRASALQPRGSGEASAARASPCGIVRERRRGGRAEANSEAAGDASTEQSLPGPERV